MPPETLIESVKPIMQKPQQAPETYHMPEATSYVAIAILISALRYVWMYSNGRIKTFKTLRMLANGGIGGVAGWLCFHAAKHFGLSEDLMVCVTGTAGWAGVEVMTVFEAFLMNMLRNKLGDKKPLEE